MQVAFWSLVHGQPATTANTVAMSVMTAVDYRLKMMVTHSHFEKNNLEASLVDKTYLKGDLIDFADTGIDALSRFCKLNKLDNNMVKNYATTIIKNRLDMLMGTLSTHRDLYIHTLSDALDKILNAANQSYDIVMIDVSSGMLELSRRILDKSDLVVVNLNQNYHIMDEYFEVYDKKFEGKKRMFAISKYDLNSRINVKTIKKRYNIRQDICVIPYNIEFSDALSMGRTADFFLKNRDVSEDDINYYFISELRNASEVMLRNLDIDYRHKRDT